MPELSLADAIFHAEISALAATPPRRPVSTYRLQVHKEFTFENVREILDYLHELGVGDVYFSPYLDARPGSTHGYDVFNHAAINPEIGSETQHAELVAALAERGMGRVLDIVPNHMGVNGPNSYWLDVLELGPHSPYAPFFDIDWHPIKNELAGRVLLPILEDQYGRVLEDGKLTVERRGGFFQLRYHDRTLPLSPKSYRVILGEAALDLSREFDEDDPNVLELLSIWASAEALPDRESRHALDIASWLREQKVMPRRIARLCDDSPAMRDVIDRAVARFRGEPGQPESFDRLHRLLEEQVYRLSSWKVASQEINYRRFFDINDLAGLRTEDARVFETIHARIFSWIEEGGISGLRIDHPDGLADPSGYFRHLQEAIFVMRCRERFRRDGHDPGEWFETAAQLTRMFGDAAKVPDAPASRPFAIVVEKILSHDEALPDDWPIDGTVGYEYLNALNGIFIDPKASEAITKTYADFTGDRESFTELLYRSKLMIAQVSLASEINALARQLSRVAEQDRRSRDFTLNDLRLAIREVIACFPVYRTYLQPDEPVSDRDRALIEQAINDARHRVPPLDASLFDFFRSVLLMEPTPLLSADVRDLRLVFVKRFQQTTGPIQAKGLEDTAFYRQVPLVSLNEVGGDPWQFGSSPAAFHAMNSDRLEHWPGTLSTTATHDTKRGEDARIRINVLSEIPHEWTAALSRWAGLNAKNKVQVGNRVAPDAREEYLFYQNLIGSWPAENFDADPSEGYVVRLREYMAKALREAKLNTSWSDPDPSYLNAITQFVTRAVSGEENGDFLADFRKFAVKIARVGMNHSLSQVVLKIASPGVPDVYQGCEFWDLSLVDPDNRRPVDYATRQESLKSLDAHRKSGASASEFAADLLAKPESGWIKQYVLTTALRHHRDNPDLFAKGAYRPVEAEGTHADKIVTILREHEGKTAVVVASRLVADLMGADAETAPVGVEIWKDTRLTLPIRRFRDLLTDRTIDVAQSRDGSVKIGEILRILPVAWLVAE